MPAGAAWGAAEAKFTANVSGSVSVAAGFMGSDAGYSTDLGGSRVLWVFGDTFWATAGSQTRLQSTFIRNCVALQTGSYDLSAATLTFYCGNTSASPRAFFDYSADSGGMPRWHWPNQGILLDDKVLLLMGSYVPYPAGPAGFQFKSAAPQAVLLDNLSGTPDTWTQMYVPTPPDVPLGVALADPGDGWVYCWGATTGKWPLLRWDRNDAKAGRLLSPQWWTQGGWSYRTGRRRRALKSVANANQNNGSVVKRPNGVWQQFMLPQYPGSALAYAESPSDMTQMGALSTFYALPEVGDSTILAYAGLAHPEQTWAGKASQDILMTYATTAAGAGNIYTDMDTYFHRVVKVTGL